jgi:hypothetical protein
MPRSCATERRDTAATASRISIGVSKVGIVLKCLTGDIDITATCRSPGINRATIRGQKRCSERRCSARAATTETRTSTVTAAAATNHFYVKPARADRRRIRSGSGC